MNLHWDLMVREKESEFPKIFILNSLEMPTSVTLLQNSSTKVYGSLKLTELGFPGVGVHLPMVLLRPRKAWLALVGRMCESSTMGLTPIHSPSQDPAGARLVAVTSVGCSTFQPPFMISFFKLLCTRGTVFLFQFKYRLSMINYF